MRMETGVKNSQAKLRTGIESGVGAGGSILKYSTVFGGLVLDEIKERCESLTV